MKHHPYEVSVGIDALLNTVLVSHGEQILVVQSSGKHWYNATSLLHNLKKAGRILGYQDLSSFLRKVSIIRLCTSFALTNFIQRNGQPVGLIVSPGLVEKGTRVLAMLGLSTDLVVGVEASDNKLDPEEIGIAVTRLLDNGARCIGICLERSHFYQAEEYRVREYIENRYPPHSLGFVPILVSSGNNTGFSDVERLTEIAVEGYIRRSLAKYHDYLERSVASAGFNGTVLIAEGKGTLTPFFRQHPAQNVLAPQGALDTINRLLIEHEGLSNGVALVVGNIKSLISIVSNQTISRTSLEDLLSSHGMGGFSSVLKRRNERFVLVPPDDIPLRGPACFGWGGHLPTLADALLITGHLGAQSLRFIHTSLDREAACTAFSTQNVQGHDDLAALAYRACYDVIEDMTIVIKSRLKHVGTTSSQPAFLISGPAGGLIGCDIAEKMGWKTVYATPGKSGSILAPATMAMNFVQDLSENLCFDDMGNSTGEVQAALLRLHAQAQRTLCCARLENIIKNWDARVVYMTCDDSLVKEIKLELPEGDENLINPESLNNFQVPTGYKTGFITVGVTGEIARSFTDVFVKSEQPVEDILPPKESTRAVYLGSNKGWCNTRVFWAPELPTGITLEGPALVEAPDTVYWIPPGWSYISVSEGFIRIERR